MKTRTIFRQITTNNIPELPVLFPYWLQVLTSSRGDPKVIMRPQCEFCPAEPGIKEPSCVIRAESGLPPTADIGGRGWHVSVGPEAAVSNCNKSSTTQRPWPAPHSAGARSPPWGGKRFRDLTGAVDENLRHGRRIGGEIGFDHPDRYPSSENITVSRPRAPQHAPTS